MLPQYTFALGGTAAIKKIIDWLNDQPDVIKRITEQIQSDESYKI